MLHTIFFDLDNTLYPKSSGLMDAIRDRIISYMRDVMNLDDNEIRSIREYSLKKYGTTLIGLIELFGVNKQHYLDYVHDLDLSVYLKKDPAIINILKSLPQRKLIFSNADQDHVLRVLDFLCIRGFFDCIIDVHTLMPNVKPQTEAFQKALKVSGLKSWDGCVFLDDDFPNIAKADEIGIFSILVDEFEKTEFKNRITSLLHLQYLLSSKN